MKNEKWIVGYTKGGIGKSSTTWHLVIALLKMGIKVRVADIDYQKTLYFENKIRISKGYSDLNIVSVQTKEALDNYLNEDFQGITFIDIGAQISPLNTYALQIASKIIIPFCGEPTQLIGLITFNQLLKEKSISKDKISILLTDIHPRKKNFTKIKASISKSYPVFLNTVIHTSKDITYTLEKGIGVTELKKKKNPRTKKLEYPKAKFQIEALALELIKG